MLLRFTGNEDEDQKIIDASVERFRQALPNLKRRILPNSGTTYSREEERHTTAAMKEMLSNPAFVKFILED